MNLQSIKKGVNSPATKAELSLTGQNSALFNDGGSLNVPSPSSTSSF